MAVVLTCYYRPKPGGFCTRLFRAVRALLDAGHEVHYLAVVPFPVVHPRCHFHRFPWPAERTDSLFFWAVFHLLAPWLLVWTALRAGATHAFAFGANYALLLQPARLLRRMPLTLFLRADALQNHLIKGRGLWLVVLEHWIEGLGLAGTALYGVSETLTSQVLARHRLLRPVRVATLPNDLEPQDGSLPQVPGEPLRLACVGVLEARKNQALAIRAMAVVPIGLAHLYIYGSGPDERMLRQLVAKLGLGERVTFAGWVEREALWHATDVLLFPSLHEGAPNAVLEALARQVAVLASNTPEHRELLSTVDLLPVDDAQAWAQAVVQLAAEPHRIEALRAHQAAAAAPLRFDWDGRVCACILGGE